MIAHFAVMNSGTSIGIGHIALFHHGIDDPVLGALHPLAYLAIRSGQGVWRYVWPKFLVQL